MKEYINQYGIVYQKFTDFFTQEINHFRKNRALLNLKSSFTKISKNKAVFRFYVDVDFK